VERTKILVHVIDMAAADGRDPYEDYQKLNHELEAFSEQLVFKTKVVVANKMDVDVAQDNLKIFRSKYKGEIFPVSAVQQTGLDELVQKLRTILCQEHSQDQ
jgi:GTP-binding protein